MAKIETNTTQKAQLDKEQREHLEDIVTEMRDRVEDNVRFQLTQMGLDTEPGSTESLAEDTRQVVEAIEIEAVDAESWSEALDQYITAVGYTIVNRLSALRVMEVRGFIEEEVTVFKNTGLTPAAETLVQEEFLLEDEAIIEAYHNKCDELAEEIDILFDRSSARSLIDPDDDTFEDLCGILDEISDSVWRADDVLGWVYEYYNVKLLDDLRRKGDREGLEPEDVPPANQFYTPHWVVRMLTDNSLGKLYLEDTGELQDVVETQESFSPDERKNRPLSPDESPDIADFCTYLVPSEEQGEPTEFEHPRELQVIDPACGSGHFLLYAFDILERIWRIETDIPNEEIPRRVLKHNLYGVDLDMRACQLAAFNLYLKGRTRANAEGADGFDMPDIGIVCADATIAEVGGVEEVFEEVAGGDPEVQQALERILDAFEEVHGLGSLLDVRGTLGDLFEDDSELAGVQLTLEDDPQETHTLGQVLHSLREAVEEHRESTSFLAQDLRSFVRLLDILAQDYDVALMNPPYGSQNRMPDVVQSYINERYRYAPEFYINFFEVCDTVTAENGRIGMLVPWSFMMKKTFEDFRKDFVGDRGSFEFLAEFGYGVLDNATVGTVGTVVRTDTNTKTGDFIRLHDVDTEDKQDSFVDTIENPEPEDIKRYYRVDLEEFSQIPGSPICYSTPDEVRQLHTSKYKLDANRADVSGESVCDAVQGLLTGNNDRFIRRYWEIDLKQSHYRPFSEGGTDAWILPKNNGVIYFKENGEMLKRLSSSRFQNTSFYGKEGLTWNYVKRTGRRFGYFPSGGVFGYSGSLLLPKSDISIWNLLSVINSDLYHALFLSITTERHWNVGEVGRVPWEKEFEENDELEELVKYQYSLRVSQRMDQPTSPFYMAPELLPDKYVDSYFRDHPHQNSLSEGISVNFNGSEPSHSVRDSARQSEVNRIKRESKLEEISDQVDELVYSILNIPQSARNNIRQEIFLRTAEDPEDREIPDPESVPDVPENIDQQVKDLVHHFAMETVRKEPDGITPVQGAEDQADMLDRIVKRFEDAYGEHAEDRLIEVDEILGSESATEEAYPNLRTFVEDDLFDYHVSRMENTPIIWKLTTERLLADSTGEGFACFVDYHSLDSGLFDRLSNQYLEPRKGELRERRSAANRRRSDESLSASEQAEAAEQYERCSNGLDQISLFEDVIRGLADTNEREFDDQIRQMTRELAPKIAVFREETRKRVNTLERLREQTSDSWFKDTFSDKFWEGIDEWREEWIDALEDLEHACEEYSKPVDEPVEAHLADLFDYFNWRLKGSDHYSSTGILFMTYYFEREGADLLDDDGQPYDNLSDRRRLVASLATGIDDSSVVDDEYLEAVADDEGLESIEDLPPIAEFKPLAEEIGDRCRTVSKQIPSGWSDRALSEIMTAGYQPNRKHGVEINITPLADAEIVPETVDEKVI